MRRRMRRLAFWSIVSVVLFGGTWSLLVSAQEKPTQADDLFSGLPPMRATGKEVFFNFRPGPKPPGDIDTRTRIPFPPPAPPKGQATAPKVAPKPLRVLRIQPSGDAQLVGAVSVTFNQPMIPLAALQDVRKFPIPFTLDPQPPGVFRWLGVSTVSFVPKDRMPFATEYEVVVPKGTKASSGVELDNEVRQRFTTPRPQVIRVLPYASEYYRTDLSPILAYAFNQRIDVKRTAAAFALYGPSGKEPVRLLTTDAWKKNPTYFHQLRYWGPEDRIIAFALKRKLRKDSRYEATFRAGLRGAEGPLPMIKTWKGAFRTYGPLRVKRARCSSEQRYALFFTNCRPEGSIWIELTNNLVYSPENEKHIEVRPKKGLHARISGSHIYISGVDGLLPSEATIRIRLKKGLKDQYGQRLRSDYNISFSTTEAQPYLHLPQGGIVALEAKGTQRMMLRMRNVPEFRLRVVPVQEGSLKRWRDFVGQVQHSRYRESDPLEGEDPLADRTFRLEKKGGAEIRHEVDFSRLLKGKQGWYFCLITAPKLAERYRWYSPHRALLVQITDVGLTARYGPDKIVLMATGIHSGKPLKRTKVQLISYNSGRRLWQGTTDAQGVALAPGVRQMKSSERTAYVLIAGSNQDRSFLILEGGGYGAVGYISGYRHYSQPNSTSTESLFFFTEREPHKPGETVHLRGILRTTITTPRGTLRKWSGSKTLRYLIRTPRWQTFKKGKLKIAEDGSFSLSVPTRESADLGNYQVQVTVANRTFYHNFQIQAYRAPEYKVNVTTGKGPFFYDQKVAAVIEGRYFFGAPMTQATATWTLRRKAGTFTPPNQPGGFRFGKQAYSYGGWMPHYGHRGGRYGRYYRHHSNAGQQIASGSGILDKRGNLEVLVDLKRDGLESVGTFTLEAQVYDQNRQSVAGRKSIIAHRSALYLGLRTQTSLIQAGKKLDVESLLVGIDGKRVSGRPYSIEAVRFESERKVVKVGKRETFQYTSKRVVEASCSPTSTAEIQRCALLLKKAGSYTLEAKVKDEQGREALTETRVYVFGPGYVPWKNKQPGTIELVADRTEYTPGQTARILVKSPFRNSRGLLTIERNGIAEHRVIVLKGSAQAVTLPIRPEYLPNVYVSLVLVQGRVKIPANQGGEENEDDPGRPASAFGQVNLKVSLTEKQIRVGIQAQPNPIRPSGELDVNLAITDHKGRGVASVVTVALVDEGVLSLLGFQTPNPLNFFYTQRPAWAVMQDLRLQLLRRLPKKKVLTKKDKASKGREGSKNEDSLQPQAVRISATSAERGGIGGRYKRSAAKSVAFGAPAPAPAMEAAAAPGGGGLGASTQAIAVRTNFATTAYYKASVQTDRYGKATMKIKMPDNLTTFRLMVVAMDVEEADRFGNGEAQIIVRKPLLLRPALPRFANYGDQFEAAVVVNNETGKDGDVQVIARGINIRFLAGQRKSVTVKAGEAREVRFLVKIVKTGIARIQFAAALDAERDAVEAQIPVLVPATAEAFATYGTTNGSIAQPIKAPADALPLFGGLKVSVSSTALTGLEDAVRYLISYPFECIEQTASRAMPIFALHKILPAFKIGKLSDQAKMKDFAEAAIAKLARSQRYDGGWGFWSGASQSSLWISGYVSYALLRARAAGYNVPPLTLSRAQTFLNYRLTRGYWPYPWEAKAYATHALALLVLSEMRAFPRNAINTVYAHRDELPLFAKAWMISVFHRQDPQDPRIESFLAVLRNRAEETASAIRFAEGQTESLRLLMHSNDRSNAIILMALLEVRPKDSMIPKIVRGLIQSRIRGHWSTTQANAYAMLGLSQYYDVYEKVEPDFTLQSWLGDGYLGQYTFQGRSMTIQEQQIPMAFLQKQGKRELVLAKKGAGRLYYRLGLRYAPRSLKLDAEEQGFAVSRTYEPIDKPDSVTRGKDGKWVFKAGHYVRVRLRIIASGDRYYTAVVDPLPAGLEAVNLAFKTSASSALANANDNRFYDSRSWYSFFAFSHQEKRDSMVVLFADRLPAGVYEYTYVARATTIGDFVIPPTRAEEMYQPETFGRTATMFGKVIEAEKP